MNKTSKTKRLEQKRGRKIDYGYASGNVCISVTVTDLVAVLDAGLPCPLGGV